MVEIDVENYANYPEGMAVQEVSIQVSEEKVLFYYLINGNIIVEIAREEKDEVIRRVHSKGMVIDIVV